GGRELSSYPDRCALQMERRTLPGEPGEAPRDEIDAILAALRREDPSFEGEARLTFGRPPYELPQGHELASRLLAAASRVGRPAAVTGASFWTDAAVLGGAGIPSVLYGPGGAGLHSTTEYVLVEDVLTCRDVLRELALDYCGGS
ncbi:MAG: M20/M25/M40 family metallo-hydrolase, partial [Acidobacteriota bacterium]|nr:M20/M25/M40 family metallo-hydrolase [Acidobacteriota bacterium]